MGVFASALSRAMLQGRPLPERRISRGLGAWLIERLRARSRGNPELRVVEQIRVSARHALLLLDVEGERLMMATSDGSTPVFYPVKKSVTSPSRRRGPVAIRVEGTCA